MDNNTHSAFIQLPGGGHAFVDGIPDECEHDFTGDDVFMSASGKTIYWHTYRQWASYTSDVRARLIYEHHEKIEDPITFGTCCCKKCKKVFMPKLW